MRQLLFAAVTIAVTASQAFGWSASGHKIVGSIAFRQLTPAQQEKIVEMLKNHPRFKEDFESQMPDDLKTPEEQNEWLFQQASVWPDLARGFRRRGCQAVPSPLVALHQHSLLSDERRSHRAAR